MPVGPRCAGATVHVPAETMEANEKTNPLIVQWRDPRIQTHSATPNVKPIAAQERIADKALHLVGQFLSQVN